VFNKKAPTMKDWTYSWVSSDNSPWPAYPAPMSTTPLNQTGSSTQIIYLYVRTGWEPMADGMTKPRAELLGYIAYNEAFKTWHIFPHKAEPLQKTADNNLTAMVMLEQFIASSSKPHKL
jgi:hypothetical protein